MLFRSSSGGMAHPVVAASSGGRWRRGSNGGASSARLLGSALAPARAELSLPLSLALAARQTGGGGGSSHGAALGGAAARPVRRQPREAVTHPRRNDAPSSPVSLHGSRFGPPHPPLRRPKLLLRPRNPQRRHPNPPLRHPTRPAMVLIRRPMPRGPHRERRRRGTSAHAGPGNRWPASVCPHPCTCRPREGGALRSLPPQGV